MRWQSKWQGSCKETQHKPYLPKSIQTLNRYFILSSILLLFTVLSLQYELVISLYSNTLWFNAIQKVNPIDLLLYVLIIFFYFSIFSVLTHNLLTKKYTRVIELLESCQQYHWFFHHHENGNWLWPLKYRWKLVDVF